jgi:protein-S-isoprenylcysteine O-methyltransferase Ste14
VRLPFGPSPFAGIALIALGIALYLWCLWGFVEAGRGTPSFLAPPERLVVSGPYRYVRNPMYLAAFMILTGEVALVPASRVIEWALGTIASVVLFVVVFEEPRLRRKFGVRYERYCATVPRWLPALRAQSSRETAQTLAPVTSARAIPGGADTPPLP